jgi:dihydrofolate synthase/folylpolyglutamate synthase
VAVLAVLGDKDVNGILEALEPVVNELVVTQNRSPRALDRDDLAQRARAVFGDERVTVADSVPEALDVALERVDEAGLGSGLLVTGSVVTAAEARELLGPRGVA